MFQCTVVFNARSPLAGLQRGQSVQYKYIHKYSINTGISTHLNTGKDKKRCTVDRSQAAARECVLLPAGVFRLLRLTRRCLLSAEAETERDERRGRIGVRGVKNCSIPECCAFYHPPVGVPFANLRQGLVLPYPTLWTAFVVVLHAMRGPREREFHVLYHRQFAHLSVPFSYISNWRRGEGRGEVFSPALGCQITPPSRSR